MKRATLVLCSIFLLAIGVFAGVTGSITGIVKDRTGAVISGATVTVFNVDTGVKSSTQTNADGLYSFPALPVGRYTIQIQAGGFSGYKETGLVLDVNTASRVDATLQVGAVSETMEVSAAAAQVNTESTQMGEVIGGKEMTSLPLDGRDYTELMALQPGVVPYTATWTGGYNPGISEGTLSISGARETANGFMVNGGSVQETMANGTSVVPNLDSIAEFRIITNNFDAEYGHYSGGIVNLVTKSGTNQFHGDAFEFVRNTGLDARNYYALTRNDFRQNQFGGTFGGPIVHNKLFFFGDYQGTRQTLGGSGFTPIPSPTDRTGNLSDQVDANGTSLLLAVDPNTGQRDLPVPVQGPAFAQTLSGELPNTVSVGEPFYTPTCNTTAWTGDTTINSTGCVFPGAVIPSAAITQLSNNLLKFVPLPNVAPSMANGYPTGAYANSGSSSNSTFGDDKVGFRLDANTRWGMVSGYYHFDDYSTFNPDAFTVGSIGSSNNKGRSQLIALGDTKTFSTSSLNEFRLSYMRNAALNGSPAGPAIDDASLGFTVGCDTLGICPVSPFKTLPGIQLNTFSFGGPTSGLGVYENIYQVLDNFSKIVGTHSLKFGGIYALSQSNEKLIEGIPSYLFSGGYAETGLDIADFLLGAPASYVQGQTIPMYDRGRYYGVYAQDSWRVRRNLTFNYGLRWDVTTPWWEKYNRNYALVPGKQSVTFPGSPLGWVFPGDPGIPSTLAPTRYGNVAPRLGVAYSPDPQGGLLQKLTGGAGKTSIRASWGMFYSDLEDWTNANENGDAPYGNYYFASFPMFATPFVDLYNGQSQGQHFPIPASIVNASPSNPDSSVDWSLFEPIGSSPAYYTGNKIPYTENYMLSLQRAIGRDTVLSVSYVGSEGHDLLVIEEANPSTPSLCLSVSQPSQVAPGSNTCGPFSENGTFTTAAGQVVQPRQRFGTAFESDGWFRTIGNSNYNALEVSLRHTVGRLSLLGSYTYSKSMDNSSTPSDQVNPFNPRLSRALSGFDMTHNFVVSYSYELPFDTAFGRSRLTRGWIVSGITRFTTGLPVTTIETDDRALIGNYAPGPTSSQDEPNYTPGKLLLQTNPRKGGPYFNTSLFTPETLGQFGNCMKRFFHGPGTNNWDLALAKDLHLTESKTLEFRGEFFNAFNHTQFGNPDGGINDGASFGFINSAGSPRIGQVAVKFMF
jgi:hypothetical protein